MTNKQTKTHTTDTHTIESCDNILTIMHVKLNIQIYILISNIYIMLTIGRKPTQ